MRALITPEMARLLATDAAKRAMQRGALLTFTPTTRASAKSNGVDQTDVMDTSPLIAKIQMLAPTHPAALRVIEKTA